VGSSHPLPVSCVVDTDIAIDFLNRRKYAGEVLDWLSVERLRAVSTIMHLEIYGERDLTNKSAPLPFWTKVFSPVDDNVRALRLSGVEGAEGASNVMMGQEEEVQLSIY